MISNKKFIKNRLKCVYDGKHSKTKEIQQKSANPKRENEIWKRNTMSKSLSPSPIKESIEKKISQSISSELHILKRAMIPLLMSLDTT